MNTQIEQIISNLSENEAAGVLAKIRKGKKVSVSYSKGTDFETILKFIKTEEAESHLENIESFLSAKYEGFDIDITQYFSFAEYCK